MATKKTFDFPLGQQVEQKCNNRIGLIIGRAQYSRANPSYLVEYCGDHGALSHDWFDEESLAKVGGGEPEPEGE